MNSNLEDQRKDKYREALQKKYMGCIFDIDGTLTVRGQEFIPAFMHGSLSDLCLRVSAAVCTGRNLALAVEKMAPVFTASKNPAYCESNWYLLCENGCLGYAYDPQEKKYKEFYRVPYPYDESQREHVFSKLKSAMDGKIEEAFMNDVSMVIRPLDSRSTDQAGVAARSRELQEIALLQLQVLDPKSLLRVADTGIAITVFPYQGNKERGTAELGKYLREKKGLNIGPNAAELAVIGDQPGPHGNDETFLNGSYGTPFTVGDTHPENILPLPVYDVQSSNILHGPEATVSLLQQLQFDTTLSMLP